MRRWTRQVEFRGVPASEFLRQFKDLPITASTDRRLARAWYLSQDKQERPGHIYFFIDLRITKWTKIGKAINPNDRLNSFKQSIPFDWIEYFHSLPVEDYTLAERYFHIRYKRFWRKGEWFDIPESDLSSIRMIHSLDVVLSNKPGWKKEDSPSEEA